MCETCNVIGESKLIPRDGIRLKEWIDCEIDENQFPIYDRIRKNITYYLGNEEQTTKLSEATDKLFDRDYKGKKQIFAPDIFITKDPSMIFSEKDELEKSLVNPDLSELEKGKWRTRLNTISGKECTAKIRSNQPEAFLARVAKL